MDDTKEQEARAQGVSLYERQLKWLQEQKKKQRKATGDMTIGISAIIQRLVDEKIKEEKSQPHNNNSK